MKQKNLTVTFSIIAIVVVSVFLLIMWQSTDNQIIESPLFPVENIPATTTPQFSFGELKNIYNDKQFNFSLNYPDEIGVGRVQKECTIDLYLMEPTKGSPPFISMYTPACPSPFANPSARSLDEYKKRNYTLDNGVVVAVTKTDDIVTSSGVHGIRQEYHIFSSTNEMENSDLNSTVPSVRYVFYNMQKGFYFLQISHLFSGAQSPYYKLVQKIIDTIQY